MNPVYIASSRFTKLRSWGALASLIALLVAGMARVAVAVPFTGLTTESYFSDATRFQWLVTWDRTVPATEDFSLSPPPQASDPWNPPEILINAANGINAGNIIFTARHDIPPNPPGDGVEHAGSDDVFFDLGNVADIVSDYEELGGAPFFEGDLDFVVYPQNFLGQPLTVVHSPHSDHYSIDFAIDTLPNEKITFYFTGVHSESIPEPSTAMLVGMGLLLLWRVRPRYRTQ